MEEIWKEIHGYEGFYKISNLGKIKSLKRKTKSAYRVRTVNEKLIKTSTNNKGYKRVVLHKHGIKKTKLIHVILFENFVGNVPEGMDVCHNDGNFLNNSIDNLRVDTRKGNLADKKIHGTQIQGEESSWSILKEAQVIEIKGLLLAGCEVNEIAKKYNVTRGAINGIKYNKSWKHVKNMEPIIS